jgi:proline iminopeptidase
VLSAEGGKAARPYSGRPAVATLAMVRICSHDFAHGAWLEEGQLIREAYRLTSIPGVLVHGAIDLSSPLDTAWRLCRNWPDAELITVGQEGHLGGGSTRRHVLAALDRFAGHRAP